MRSHSKAKRRTRLGEGLLRIAILALAAVAVLGGCKSAPPAPDPDGFLLRVTLGDGYNRQLVTGMEVVFDAAPGAAGLGLSPSAPQTFESKGISYEVSNRSVDRDPEPEYVLKFTQNPFAAASRFEFYFSAPTQATPSLSVRVNLLSARGQLASAVATQFPGGESVQVGPGIKTTLEVGFPCVTGSTCLTAAQENRAPVVAPMGTVGIRQGRTLTLVVDAFDPDGDPLTYSAVLANVEGATFDAETRRFQWTPDAAKVREDSYEVRFEVQDDRGGTSNTTVQIVVTADNSSPLWSPVARRAAVEGQTLSVQLQVEDPDADPLTITLDTSGLPLAHDAAYNEGTKTFTWTPTWEDGRNEPWTVALEANDGKGGVSRLTFEVVVADVNAAPQITAPASLQVRAEQMLSLALQVRDRDGDTVTVSANFDGLPTGNDANFDPGSLTFTWRPRAGDARATPWIARFEATDARGASHIARLELVVSASNGAPLFAAIAPQLAAADQQLRFQVEATDPEGGQVTLSPDTAGLPEGNNAALADGWFTWTPQRQDARDNPYRVGFIATDTEGASTVLDVLITVNVGLARPAPPTVAETDPPSPANKNDPVVVGTAAAGDMVSVFSTADCSGAPIGTGTADELGAFRIAVVVQDDTTTALRARATNEAGDSDCSTTSVTYVEDSTAPAPPTGLATTPASPANENAPSVSGSTEAAALIRVHDSAGCTGNPIGEATAAANGSFTLAVSVSDNSTNGFAATATDAAGNTSGCSASTEYREDSQAPATPADLGFSPPSPANESNAALTGTTEVGATVSVFMNATCTGDPAATLTADGAGTFRHPFTAGDDTTTEWSVKITDGASNVSDCSGAAAYVEDSTAPDIASAQVRDGPGADATFQSSNSGMVANWTGFTDLGGLAGYDYNISSTASCAGDVFGTTDVGNVTSQMTGGLTLTNSSTYFNCVRARDAAGNVSSWVASNGITIDTTVPAPPALNGFPAPINGNEVTVGGTVSDAGLTVKVYQNADCTEPAAQTTVSTTGGAFSTSFTVGDDTTTTFSAVVLSTAQVPSGCAAPVTYVEDSTNPSAMGGTVADGSGADLTYQNGTTSTTSAWSGFTDQNGVVGYQHNLSTTGACDGDVAPTAAAGTGPTHNRTALSLANGSTYFNCIRALDAAGNASAWVASNGVTVDNVKPAVGGASVRDGTGSDVDFQITATALSSNWLGFTDDRSGIASYEYNLSTSAACAGNVEATVDVGNGTSHQVVRSLQNATEYFNCVRAVDVAGNRSDWVASDGVTIDTSDPTFSRTINVTAVTVDSVSLSWSAGSDNVTPASRLIYEVCADTQPASAGGCSPFSVTKISGAGETSVTITGRSSNTRYFFKVRAVDEAGRTRTSSSEAQAKTWSDRAVAEISVGPLHQCARLSDGSAWCWGNNIEKQLGATSATTRQVHHEWTNVRSVAAGDRFSCAVRGDRVYCWGRNNLGQLGLGTRGASTATPTMNSVLYVVKVVAGNGHACALQYNGDVYCWGDNEHGQIGNGSTNTMGVPTPFKALNSVIDIAAGANHTCAVLGNGSVACWGLNLYGQLGDNSTTRREVPVTTYDSPTTSPMEAIAISAGGSHTCAIDRAHEVYCWGQNTKGQLCTGNNDEVHYAVKTDIGVARSVAASGQHSCAVRPNGSVVCCGENQDGQLGNGGNIDQNAPTAVSSLGTGTTRFVAAGNTGTCAIRSDGSLRCWGDTDTIDANTPQAVTFVVGRVGAVKMSAGSDWTYALLNDGTVQRWGGGNTRAQPFSGLTNVIDLTTGGNAGCALRTNGQVKCWGLPFSSGSIVDISGLTDALSITNGFDHACAVRGAGEVMCWGNNSRGQLGNETYNPSLSTAVPVTGFSSSNPAASVSGGTAFTCALEISATPAKRIWCWGDNSDGQLGAASPARSNLRLQVAAGNSDFVEVAAGSDHACVLRVTGAASCWGDNANGQLGNNSTTPSTSLVSVSGLTTGVHLELGRNHSCATSRSGTVLCWGFNNHGQIGNNSTPVDALTAKTVSSLSNAAGPPAAGYDHTCAVQTDGTAECWGDNFEGALGDGTNTERSSAVNVIDFP